VHDVLEEDYLNLDQFIDYDAPQFKMDCAFCNGTGVHPATMKSLTFESCPVCEGKGMIEIMAKRRDFEVCAQCSGSGKEPNSSPIQPCRVCGGLGIHAVN